MKSEFISIMGDDSEVTSSSATSSSSSGNNNKQSHHHGGHGAHHNHHNNHVNVNGHGHNHHHHHGQHHQPHHGHHPELIITDVIVSQTNIGGDQESIGGGSSANGDVDLDLWDLDLNNVYVNNGSVESNTGSIISTNNSNNNGTNNSSNSASNNHHSGSNVTFTTGKRTTTRQHSLAVSSFSDSSSGREDLSPPGGFGADSCGDGKKKKGPVPRQQEELCLVCGDRASGYHYNALTCEGCKGFFRRSITKNAVYQCKYGNSCEIDMYMRRKCQECRLKKCLTVGMRPECVVPEYQCAVKREAKKAQKEKDKPNSTTQSPTPKEVEISKEERLMTPDRLSTGKHPTIGGRSLSVEQEELINRLVYFQDEFEQPSEEDLKRLSSLPTEGEDASEVRFRHITEMTILTVQLIVEFSKRLPGFDKLEREDQITLLKEPPVQIHDSEAKFKHITEMTILTVQLTVEFAKRLPGFDTLLREDQITLLKACSSEVMMLRTARRYDFQTDTIVFANNHPYSRENYCMAGVGDSADPLFNFCRHMCTMKVDNAEYALLTAIVIFSERPLLLEPRKVEKIQEIYLEALRAYVEYLHPVRPGVNFARLLGVLTELRTLGNINSEMCFSLKLKNKKLPPFLAEIWDVST